MSQKRLNQPPDLKKEFPLSFTIGLVFMTCVLLALPISQLIDKLGGKGNTQVEAIEYKPPPVIEEPPPPEEEEEQEEIDEVEQEREPPTLAQLELSMNTDLSGFNSSDFTVPTIDISAQMDEIIYELEDLTRAPRPISQRAPQYPPELRRAGISGRVWVLYVVRSDGTTSNITIEKSDNPAFEEPCIRAIRKWRFDPGEKDGKPVTVRVRQEIPFTFNR